MSEANTGSSPKAPKDGGLSTATPPGATPAPSSAGQASAENKPNPPAPGLEPTLIAPGAKVSQMHSRAFEDLGGDKLLKNAKRIEYEGLSVPSLGGIPLLAKLGQGGMGAVYFGVKIMLKQEVAVKVLPEHLAEQQPKLVERFLREAQIASRVESARLVRVTDVNQEAGLYYLVMEFVNGISAGDYRRRSAEAGQERLGEAVVLDICIAGTTGLAAAHKAGIVHRDVKPDNMLIPQSKDGTLRFSEAKLADLGLARAEDLVGASLTGAQSSMGTPGYMAPEQAMNAKKAGKPADVFSMGASLYAMLAGQSPFRGETSTETIMATIQQAHKPLREARPDASPVTSELIDRCLAKDPAQRFVDGSALLEALQVARASVSLPDAERQAALQKISVLQKAAEVGDAVRPTDSGAGATPSQPGTPPPTGASASSAPPAPSRRGALAAVAVLAAAGGLYAYLGGPKEEPGGEGGGAAPTAPAVHLGMVCGNEKTAWMNWAVQEFAKTPEGQHAEIQVLTMGAEEAHQALLKGDERIHAWTPASTMYRELFVKEWKEKYRQEPFAEEDECLALTPLVYMMYKDRYEAFVKKYNNLSLKTLGQALREEKGLWAAIANDPECKWGELTFAFADPTRFGTGQTILVLMAYEYQKKNSGLTPAEVNAPEFQAYVRSYETMFRTRGSSTQAVKDMVLKGPSIYDGALTYEATAMQNIKNAEGRFGEVRIEYPEVNVWNDHPGYILDAPWSSQAHKKAASAFLHFLNSEVSQKELLKFGFRPGDPAVSLLGPESPFTKYESLGFRKDISITVGAPSAAVLKALNDFAEKWMGGGGS